MSICRICGHSEDLRKIVAREMQFGMRDVFEYLECARCGCIQIAEVPETLGDYYPANYYSFSGHDWSPGTTVKSRLMRWAVRLAGPGSKTSGRILARSSAFREIAPWLRSAHVRRGSRILDVGSGSGELLRKLQALGFRRLTGVDPLIPNDVDLGPHAKVFRRSLEEQTGAFDLVMAHHSFEHMADPAGALAHMARLLAPRGSILLRIPVAQSEAWHRFGVNWVQFDAPRHLFLHTARSIELLAAKVDLTVRETIYDSTEFQFSGSTLYERDIPLFDDSTRAFRSIHALFEIEEIAAFEAEAVRLNACGRGDQACFFLQRPGDAARH